MDKSSIEDSFFPCLRIRVVDMIKRRGFLFQICEEVLEIMHIGERFQIPFRFRDLFDLLEACIDSFLRMGKVFLQYPGYCRILALAKITFKLLQDKLIWIAIILSRNAIECFSCLLIRLHAHTNQILLRCGVREPIAESNEGSGDDSERGTVITAGKINVSKFLRISYVIENDIIRPMIFVEHGSRFTEQLAETIRRMLQHSDH